MNDGNKLLECVFLYKSEHSGADKDKSWATGKIWVVAKLPLIASKVY